MITCCQRASQVLLMRAACIHALFALAQKTARWGELQGIRGVTEPDGACVAALHAPGYCSEGCGALPSSTSMRSGKRGGGAQRSTSLKELPHKKRPKPENTRSTRGPPSSKPITNSAPEEPSSGVVLCGDCNVYFPHLCEKPGGHLQLRHGAVTRAIRLLHSIVFSMLEGTCHSLFGHKVMATTN